MHGINHNRRKILKLGLASMAVGVVTVSKSYAVTSSTRIKEDMRTINLRSSHTNEVIKSTYYANGRYNYSELQKLNHFMRDFRTGGVLEIDPKLYDKLHLVNTHFGQDKQIELISGYRSPQTNKKLRNAHVNSGVAKNSLHMYGKAIDFRIKGISLEDILRFVMSMNNGGVGYYPKSNFIHMDTGDIRCWPRSSIAKVISKSSFKHV